MATQANPYLIITDGVATATFADGAGGNTNWGVRAQTWAPNVAPLRRSPLGGRGPYADVVEELTINVRDSGATAAAAMANLNTLSLLLDQAERWARGEFVNAVLVKYVPQGSTIAANATPYQAVVLGRASEDMGAMLGLPPRWDQLGMIKELWDVKVRFVRTGQWLLGDQQASTVPSLTSGVVTDVAFASGLGGATPHAPLAMTLGTWTTTNVATLNSGFLMCTGNTPGSENGIKVSTAPFSGLGTGGYTNINESANNAISGANTARYTPTGTAFSRCRVGPINWTAAHRLGIFATVRNNDATKSYQIRAGYSKDTAAVSAVRTGTVVVDGSSTSPQAIFIGILTIPNAQYGDVFIEIAASATGSTFDIDQIVVVCLDDDTSCVLGHDGMNMSGTFGAGVTVFLDIQNQILTRPEPFVGVHQQSVTDGIALTYRGDARFRTGLTEINVLWLTTSGAKWRFSQGGGSLQTVSVTARQFNAYLTPV